LLCGLVLAGAALRVGAIMAERPVVMVYGDSYSYLYNAAHLGPDPFHPLVYPLFLWAFWWTANLQAVVILQHLLAILLSVAIYATLRHLAVRRWLAAMSVAPLLLDAYQVFVEQNILSETVFEVLVTATLIVVVRWRQARVRWAIGAVAGLLGGAAVLTRGVGLAVIPAAFLVPLLGGRGWRQPAATVLAAVLLVGAYAAWNYEVNGQFTFAQYSGRWLYGRVETIADCGKLHGIPADERVLCDPAYGADPRGLAAVDSGVGFYVWDPRSPLYRLRPAGHRTRDEIAEDYALRVIANEPGRYFWSVVVDTAVYFAPTREAVAAGQSPLESGNFQPGTNPGQNHVLIGTQSFADQTTITRLPGSQEASWPVSWLNRYQIAGYIPGPMLAVCLVLVLIAAAWGSRDRTGRDQREGALLFGLTGLLLVMVPAAVAGNEYRYLLPALPVIPPAGAAAMESLTRPVRRGVDRLRERARRLSERVTCHKP
jgi:4-amino-4-deoxy-L-arabinose transferase-like glycosyltransferase